ncbi:type II secretion system protein [Opitutaceae bacterium TAV4]|nr:type II secretion system protein [Opitutaceae bacterium TAV4]RRK02087.1 type II secretion system protein [Opitutaceae bacterium TAV3]
MKQHHLHPIHAFTLIELLAVITIIGVLAAIIIPVAGHVRESAKSTRCLSNLRQVGPAFMAYVADNRERYPVSWNGTDTFDNNWYYLLAPYVGRPLPTSWRTIIALCLPDAPFGCPNVDINDPAYERPWMSYKMTGAHRDYLTNGGANGVATQIGLPVALVENPATSLLVAEGREHPDFLSRTAPELIYPHHNKLNALFADGHVASFTEKQIEERWNEFYTPAASN